MRTHTYTYIHTCVVGVCIVTLALIGRKNALGKVSVKQAHILLQHLHMLLGDNVRQHREGAVASRVISSCCNTLQSSSRWGEGNTQKLVSLYSIVQYNPHLFCFTPRNNKDQAHLCRIGSRAKMKRYSTCAPVCQQHRLPVFL